jgi:hypothetical protein
LAHTQGLVFVGTDSDTKTTGGVGRFWRFVLIGGRLREGQLIRTWDEFAANPVPYALHATRDSVYTLVSDAVADNTSHVWRYDLVTGGMFRENKLGVNATIDAFASMWDVNGGLPGAFAGPRLFFTRTGAALYRNIVPKETSGFLISPLADFFNASNKTWLGARLATGAMPTDTQVVLAYSTDPAAIEDDGHASWVDVITADDADPGDSTEFPMTNVESRYVAAKLTLTPGAIDDTGTPRVRAFAFRGLPLDAETDYAIPVNISDRLELPHRKPLTVDGVGDAVYEQLQTIRGKSVTVTLLQPDEVVIGQIRSVSVPFEELPHRGSPSAYALVTIRGQKQ